MEREKGSKREISLSGNQNIKDLPAENKESSSSDGTEEKETKSDCHISCLISGHPSVQSRRMFLSTILEMCFLKMYFIF
jgi:hypothetical protein